MTISVECVAEQYEIRFSIPVSLYVLAVATAEGEIVWKVSPNGMAGNEAIKAAVASVDQELMPAAVQRYAEDVRAAASTNAAPAVDRITYGVVPEGYKERAVARPLRRGTRYHVVAMGIGADAAAAFTTEE